MCSLLPRPRTHSSGPNITSRHHQMAFIAASRSVAPQSEASPCWLFISSSFLPALHKGDFRRRPASFLGLNGVSAHTWRKPMQALRKSDCQRCKLVNSAYGIVVDFIHLITMNSGEVLPSETCAAV